MRASAGSANLRTQKFDEESTNATISIDIAQPQSIFRLRIPSLVCFDEFCFPLVPMKNSNSYCAAVAAFCLAPTAFAGIFVSTGQTGAQVQCDINHTQHWTYSVSENVSDIGGALLTMKGGSQTTSPISFVIFEGTYADFGSSAYLLSVTLDSSAFTQAFTPIEFFSTPISLLAGNVYTAVLFSSAGDSQNAAYFIKGGSDTPLKFVNELGDPITNGPSITPPTPAPGALALLALAGFAARRRRH